MKGLFLPAHLRRRPQPRDHYPQWLDLLHPEAVRGTNRLQLFDRDLVAGLDVRRGVFQVWGKSKTEGLVPICDCRDDDGQPFLSPPWDRILGELFDMREGPSAAERARTENEKREAAEEAAEQRRLREAAQWYLQGGARNRCEDIQDVSDAWTRQVEGEKPAPRGRIISVGRTAPAHERSN